MELASLSPSQSRAGSATAAEPSAAASPAATSGSNVTIFRRSLDLTSSAPPAARVPAATAAVAEETVARTPTPPSAAAQQAEYDDAGDEHKRHEAFDGHTILGAPKQLPQPASMDGALQSISIESPKGKSGGTAPAGAESAWLATPLLKPQPNWRNPNVDLKRLSVPYPTAAAEPHVVASGLPWLQRYVDRRWRFLFPAYRRLDVWGLRGFSLCELVFLAIYSLVNLALIVSGIAEIATAAHGVGYQTGTLYNTGVNFGTYGTINVLLLLLPNTRSNVWQYVLGMSFERSVWYHKWIARVAVAELTIHGAAVYADSYYNQRLWADASDGGVTGVYGSGSISYFIAVAIVLLSLYPLRRYLHELFLRVHIVLFVAFLVFGFIHEGTVALVAPALVLYAADWALRISMWRQPVRVLNVKLLPGGVTRITFQKDAFTYSAGQYIFVCVPAVSPFEWHPFSLSSSPHHPVLTVHCKATGRWTRRLAELARKGEAEGRDWTKLKMHTEGPYGLLSVPLSDYSSVLLVCGGIGVTPLGSVYNSLVHEHYRGVRRLRQLKLVWSLREPALIKSLYDDVRRAEAVEQEERADAKGEPPSYFFDPQALARRDALIHTASTTLPPATEQTEAATEQSQQRLAVQPLAGRIHNAFHLTALSSAEADREQLRGVQSYYGEWVREGRPELADAFGEMRAALLEERAEAAKATAVSAAGAEVQSSGAGVSRCAVLACGPRLLIDDVRAFCIRQSSAEVRFDLHEEEFSW